MFGFILIDIDSVNTQITPAMMKQLTGQKCVLQTWKIEDLQFYVLSAETKQATPDGTIACIELRMGDRIKYLTQALYAANFVAVFQDNFLTIEKNSSGLFGQTLDLANRDQCTVKELMAELKL